ncbi:MAG: hypothetical protein CMM27_10620 [Rhodospirillaceae bacterium]|nr:hypothetical protein [Rhodospirillaceae bacterium]
MPNRTWTLSISGKLFTLNTERGWHHHKRAKFVKEWRQAAYEEAIKAKVPKMRSLEVIFVPCRKDRRHMADTGGHFPVAKACIDGLVDAGVIPDDGPEFVTSLTFKAPQVDGGVDRALLVINETGK